MVVATTNKTAQTGTCLMVSLVTVSKCSSCTDVSFNRGIVGFFICFIGVFCMVRCLTELTVEFLDFIQVLMLSFALLIVPNLNQFLHTGQNSIGEQKPLTGLYLNFIHGCHENPNFW